MPMLYSEKSDRTHATVISAICLLHHPFLLAWPSLDEANRPSLKIAADQLD